MKLLGYILLLLNAVAGAAVLYLASQSLGQRNEQSANALRYYMLKDGLPLEGAAVQSGAADDTRVPVGIPMGKGHTVETVSLLFLKKHFEGTDGGAYSDPLPPASRVAELTRLKAKADDAYAKKNTDAERLAFLVGGYRGLRFFPGPLVLLADTFDERQAYKALTGELVWPAGKPRALKAEEVLANAKKAKETFDAKFDAAINKPVPGKYAEDIAKIDAAKKALRDDEAEAKRVADDQKLAAAVYYKEMGSVLGGEKSEVEADVQKKFAEFIGDAKGANAAAVKGKSRLAVEKVTATAYRLQEVILNTGLTAYDDNDRKRRGTVVLQALDPSEAWQKRVLLTVGQTDYLAGVQDRIERQPDYPSRLDRLKDYSTIRFFESYDRSKEQARDLDRLLVRQTEIRVSLEDQAARAKLLLAQRKGQRDVSKADSEETEATVTLFVANQDAVEKELFDLQNRVGAMLRSNFELEDRVIVAEKRLPAGK